MAMESLVASSSSMLRLLPHQVKGIQPLNAAQPVHSLKTCTGQLPLPLTPHQSLMHFLWNLQRHSSLPISSPGWNSSMQIVHSCSRPSPSMQSFSVAIYGKMPRERYDIARARALDVASVAVGHREKMVDWDRVGLSVEWVPGLVPEMGEMVESRSGC